MNSTHSKFSFGDKPSGYMHIHKEFWDAMKRMMAICKDGSPLSKFRSIACKFEPTYMYFTRNPTGKQKTGNWYNDDYRGPEPYVMINVSYYVIPGYLMEPSELKEYRMSIKLTINMEFFVQTNRSLPVYYTYDNFFEYLEEINHEIYDRYHGYIEWSHEEIIRQMKNNKKQYHRKYRQEHPEKLELVKCLTSFQRRTIFYNDGTTSIIYKHSNTSYTIETFTLTSGDVTFTEIDDENASEKICRIILDTYKFKLGCVRKT